MTLDDVTPAAVSVAELVSLRGRRAVVTGGARGLGRAMGRRLLDAGASVLFADLDGDLAAEVAAELGKEASGQAVGVCCDVTDTSSVTAAADLAIQTMGGLDIWVNNAGVMPTAGPFLDADEAVESTILRVNLEGTIRGARAAARRMPAGGVIVNVSSSSAFRAGVGVAAYASSKAGVAALTRNLAVELGRRGIRVLGVAPHIVDTPGTRREAETLASAGSSLEKLARANPLRMAIDADHVARVVLFAVSDLAAAMSGSTLLVDGGLLS